MRLGRGNRTALFLAVFACAAARAHEIGTTRVTAAFHRDRTYEIEILTDRSALAEKLAAVRVPFEKRIRVAFGAVAVTPSVQLFPGAIRLTGSIPPDGGSFTWKYDWTYASYSLTLRTDASAQSSTQWLEGGQTSEPFALDDLGPAPGRWQIVRRYVALGFTHILPHGLDHMLFVLGIYLLSGRARAVLLQVSAFTIAHSITLGLSLYGVVTVPSTIVEPLIAVSIAYIAVENIFLAELKSRRVALVFAFGLLHGMGFAGALKELGLPRSEFLTALLSFNAGVETGQLAVIAAAFLVFGRRWAGRSWYRSRVVVPASALIACMAVYWTLQRLRF